MGQQSSSEASNDGPNNPDTVWWCRLLSRVIGCLAGVICLICGVVRVLTFTPICLASAILMFILGVLVLIFEAPICCQFLDITKPVGAWAEKRSYFQRAFLYAGCAILPFGLCVSLSTLFGCGAVFAAGVFYGLMALGKKADREQMMANAQNVENGTGVRSDSMSADLVGNEQRTSKDNPFSQY